MHLYIFSFIFEIIFKKYILVYKEKNSRVAPFLIVKFSTFYVDHELNYTTLCIICIYSYCGPILGQARTEFLIFIKK
jgi:hypothetical protein